MTLADLKQAGIDYLLASPNITAAEAMDGLTPDAVTWTVSGPRGKGVVSMAVFTGDASGWEAKAKVRWDSLIAWMGQ